MRIFSLLLLSGAMFAQTPQFHFAEHTLAKDLKGGYQVVAVDVNHDGKVDLIALASGMPDLLWFENPGPGVKHWARHVIASNLPHMINLAAWDIDGDGIPEIVIAYEFANQAKNSIGILALLEHQGDPRQPWKVSEIDRLTTSHRLRWADIYGNGKKVLVDAPLSGPKAEAPEYKGQTPLVFYKPGEWKRELISEANEGVQHGIHIAPWDRKGRDGILTASFSGIHLYRLGKDGKWNRTEIAKGDPSPCPKCGSSDVAVGYLGKQRYLAAVEPWHGNELSIYSPKGKEWERTVLTDSLVQGHTIATADLSGSKRDDVIVGFRGKGQSVWLYSADDARGKHWTKTVLDAGGMAASACAVADLNGDGRPDIACIGGATMNLKWYENQTVHGKPTPLTDK